MKAINADYILECPMLHTMKKRDVLNLVKEAPALDMVSSAAFEQVKWERDTAIAQLRDDYGVGLAQIKPLQKPLSPEDLGGLIGCAVYVENLLIKSYPPVTHPAAVFSWRYKNPDEPIINNPNPRLIPINEITVVQPSALASATVYHEIKDYNKSWRAWLNKPSEEEVNAANGAGQ